MLMTCRTLRPPGLAVVARSLRIVAAQAGSRRLSMSHAGARIQGRIRGRRPEAVNPFLRGAVMSLLAKRVRGRVIERCSHSRIFDLMSGMKWLFEVERAARPSPSRRRESSNVAALSEVSGRQCRRSQDSRAAVSASPRSPNVRHKPSPWSPPPHLRRPSRSGEHPRTLLRRAQSVRAGNLTVLEWRLPWISTGGRR